MSVAHHVAPGSSSTVEIPISRGVVLVDAVDFDWLSEHRWHRYEKRGGYYTYATRVVPAADGGAQRVWMHREILDAPPDLFVDHINGNGLDNRRSNLRLVTTAQNHWNRRSSRGATSRFKGVSWISAKRSWRAAIQGDWLGGFTCEEDAARAYDREALKRYGVFARLNFPADDAASAAIDRAVIVDHASKTAPQIENCTCHSRRSA